MIDNRRLSLFIYFSYMLMSGLLLIQIIAFGHVLVSSSVIKISIFSFVFVCFLWRMVNKLKIRFNFALGLLAIILIYSLSNALLKPEYNYENFGYYSCLITMFLFSIGKSESIIQYRHQRTQNMSGSTVVVLILFLIVSLISVIEQINNSPLLSQSLGVPAASGVHYIDSDSSLYVFYGWHDEVLPILNLSLGVYFRSVSIFPNGLDLGLMAIFFFCFFWNKIKFSNHQGRFEKTNILWLSCLFLSCIVAFGTHTRVVWVALVFVAYYYIVIGLNKGNKKNISILLFFGLITQVAFTAFATVYSMYASSDENIDSVLERVNSWITATKLLLQSQSSILFGTGIVESPSNGLLLDNTFISIVLYSGLVGLSFVIIYYAIICFKSTNVFIRISGNHLANEINVCPIVLTGAPILYVLPILWSFNNYQQKLIIFYLFPIMLVSCFSRRERK